jgi:DNA-binding beta-propeller fold protein YncE
MIDFARARVSLIAGLVGVASLAVAMPTGIALRDIVNVDPTHSDPSLKGVDRLSAVAISSGGGAFVFGTWRDGVSVFGREPDGALTLLWLAAGSPGAINDPTTLTLSPDGKHLYVVSPGSTSLQLMPGTIEVFTVDETTGLPTHAFSYTRTPAEPFGGGLEAVVSPDGAHLYVAARFDGNVTVFARDALTGALTFLGTAVGPPPFEPTDVALSADGMSAYVVDAEERLHTFARDSLTGALTWQAAVTVTGAADAIVSPDLLNVYATGRTKENGVHRFARDPLTGALTFVDVAFEQSRIGADSLAMSDDGTLLLAVSPKYVALYARDTGGALAFLGSDRYPSAEMGVFAPDDQVAYAAGSFRPAGVFRITSFACESVPRAGCLTPTLARKSALKINRGSTPARDVISWTWTKGQATVLADFGDVTIGANANDTALCVYDASGGAQPLVNADLPSGGVCPSEPCWSSNGTNRLKYKDLGYLPDGVYAATFRTGAAGESRAKVKAKQNAVPMPSLPLTTPVRVQWQTASAGCLEATFSVASRNDGTQFAAKSD